MRRRHVILDCYTEDDQTPHYKLDVKERKNWQSKNQTYDNEGEVDGESSFTLFYIHLMNADFCSLSGQVYQVYPLPDLPHLDVYPQLLEWMDFLEKYVLKCKLQPDDYFFGYVGPNGVVHPERHASHNVVQDVITRYTEAAGIHPSHGKFTTHCFRRGGLQFRLMYASRAHRWALSICRWWGGWAAGEHVRSFTFSVLFLS